MPSEWPSFNRERVREYYERHTRTFVTFGEGGAFGAMHRAVAGPGVVSQAAAFRHVEDVILEVAQPLRASDRPLRVVDLGCGVGGSLCYLAERGPIDGVGVTLSPTQAALARERIATAQLADRLRIVEGDYMELALDAPVDLAYAIESFVHAPDALRFLERCVRLVRAGGLVVICDDFLRPVADSRAPAAIERFRRGWHVNTLMEREQLLALAADAGLHYVSSRDLSPHLQIGRPRDRVVDIFAAAVERLPWRPQRLGPWLGGSALQRCLRNGWIGYDLFVFRSAV